MSTTATNETQYHRECGVLHRIGGPAVVSPSGAQGWYQNGKLHRTDGPAMITKSGETRYYLNGNRHSHKKWLELVKDGTQWISIQEIRKMLDNENIIIV